MLPTLRRGLSALLVVLAVSPGTAGSSAAQPKLTPGRVHVVAEQATVLRGLLGIADSLTYDAVALKPSREALAAHIRAQNEVLIRLCNAIIRDDARISWTERKLRQAHASRGGEFNVSNLHQIINDMTEQVRGKLKKISVDDKNKSLSAMYEMQML